MSRILFTDLEASGILTPQKMGGPGNRNFSINPYVGCAFGCSYCYVRGMQYGDDAEEKSATWGNWVKIKSNAVALIQKSYKRLYGKRIFMGSATDPYQPIERKARLTRALLESILFAYPEHLHIQTRSPLVTLDIDLFLRYGDLISIGMSLPTEDERVRKVFEPSAPSIPQRLKALRELHDAGIRTIASFAPILPCDPIRLAQVTKGLAEGFWVDRMNYHEYDADMKRRYRDNGWERWMKPDTDALHQTIESVWHGTQSEASDDTDLSPPLASSNLATR